MRWDRSDRQVKGRRAGGGERGGGGQEADVTAKRGG